LRTEKITSSQTTGTRVFYFNGGTLQAGNGNLGATPFMNSLSDAFIRNGGAVVDSQGFSIIISQALEHSNVGGDNAIDGGLTKLGTGTLTLTGTNVFTGPITNKAGTLVLTSPSTYTGAVVVNAGTLQMTTAPIIQGGTTVSNGALLSIVQQGTATLSLSNLTFNGAASGPGATLGLTTTTANNPNVALVNCGTLTLNGTNTISLAAVNVGTLALVNYVGAMNNQPSNYTSGEGVVVPNTTFLLYRQPSYYTLDANFGVMKDNWSIGLFGSNLNNTHASMFTSSAQFIKAEVPVRPAVIGLKLGATF